MRCQKFRKRREDLSLEQCVVVPVSMFGAMFFRALGAARSGFLQLQDTLRRVVLGQWLLVEGIFKLFFKLGLPRHHVRSLGSRCFGFSYPELRKRGFWSLQMPVRRKLLILWPRHPCELRKKKSRAQLFSRHACHRAQQVRLRA